TLDIVRMHSRQIVRRYLHIIDKDQRIHFTRTEGGDSPDKKLRIVLSRFAGSLIGNHTGDTACQGSGQVTGSSTQFLHIHRGNRGYYTFLFLFSARTDRYVFQFFGLLQQRHAKPFFGPDLYDLGTHSTKGELQFFRLSIRDLEGPVPIGDYTAGGS